MSKMKFSFSLILTIILVGILSTSVFARSTYWSALTANTASGNLTGYTFKFINTSDTAKDFTVKVYSDADNYATPLFTTSTGLTAVAPHSEPTGAASEYTSVTVTTTDVAFKDGVVYKFTLYNGTNDTENKFAVTTLHDNKKLYNVVDNPTEVDVNGSGLTNANHTGQPGATKKGGNTHGFYQNNTNSCAGCHQTHTANNGEALLFKDGVYSTCSACHDGTTGAYNAFATANKETPNEIAGSFNVKQDATHNGSLHQSDGSINVNAAPGGSKASTLNWGSEFNCASCHAPHGAGSASENNLNIDPMGWGGVEYKALPDGVTLVTATAAQKDALNGKLFKGVQVYSSATDATAVALKAPVILVKSAAPADVETVDTTKTPKNATGLYARVGVKATDYILQTYKWNGSKYVADYSLWLKDDPNAHTSTGFAPTNTVLTGASEALKIVWRDGFAYGDQAAVDAVTGAVISLGIDVETTLDIKSLMDSTYENYVYDSGTEMGKYCAACHTDYYTKRSTTAKTGTYTSAHRHTTNSDRLTCVRCHFGHGTDAQIMKDANDETYFTKVEEGMTPAAALDYLKDVNPSSALKRYTGMAVCYACHGDGAQFINNVANESVQSTDAAVKAIYGSHAVGGDDGEDSLLPGDPGSAGRGTAE